MRTTAVGFDKPWQGFASCDSTSRGPVLLLTDPDNECVFLQHFDCCGMRPASASMQYGPAYIASKVRLANVCQAAAVANALQSNSARSPFPPSQICSLMVFALNEQCA
jgi:hypothetical protein